MKYISLLVFIVSFSIQASVIDGSTISDTLWLDDSANGDEYTYVEVQNDITLSETLYLSVLNFAGADSRYCLKEMVELSKLTSDYREFFYIARTTDDACDGGNTMGLVFDQGFNRIGEIFDGDISLY